MGVNASWKEDTSSFDGGGVPAVNRVEDDQWLAAAGALEAEGTDGAEGIPLTSCSKVSFQWATAEWGYIPPLSLTSEDKSDTQDDQIVRESLARSSTNDAGGGELPPKWGEEGI